MKKIILLAALVSFNFLSAQDKYETYDCRYNDKTYDILVSKSSKGVVTVWVDILSLDSSVDKTGFTLKDEQLNSFIQNLKIAQEKYNAWDITAKENKVTELSKKIEIKSEKLQGYFLPYDKWKFDWSVRLSYTYKIMDDKHLLIIRTGEMTASDNQYTDCSNAALVFSSSEEIDDFIALIQPEKITAFLAKPNAEDLFN